MDKAKESGSLLGRIRKVPSGLPRSILSASDRLQSTSQLTWLSCGRDAATATGGSTGNDEADKMAASRVVDEEASRVLCSRSEAMDWRLSP